MIQYDSLASSVHVLHYYRHGEHTVLSLARQSNPSPHFYALQNIREFTVQPLGGDVNSYSGPVGMEVLP